MPDVSQKLIFRILICSFHFKICSLLKPSPAYVQEVCEFTESVDINESNFSQVYYKSLLFWHLQFFVQSGQFPFSFRNPLQLIICNILLVNKITLGMAMCGFRK